MIVKQKNNRSGRKTFLVIGLLVATLIMLQGSNWDLFGASSFTQKLTLSTKDVKGKVVSFGRFTKSVLNTFD